MRGLPPKQRVETLALGCRVGVATTFAFDRDDKNIFEVDSSESVQKCNRSGTELYTIGQGVLDTASYVYAFPAGND